MSRKLQVYPTDDLVVTYDPNVCIHAAECVRGLPAVFDVSRPDWIRPAAAPAAEVAEVIGRCPSGALQVVRAGVAPARVPAPAGERVTVQVLRDGPNRVTGGAAVELPTGEREERRGTFSLCRCGGTGTPPFCDGTHGKLRFRSPR